MDFQTHLREFLSKIDQQKLITELKKQPIFGCFIHPNKLSSTFFQDTFPWVLSHPLVAKGYYSHDQRIPGKHPYHAGGAFYIQEPSAMVVSSVWSYRPHDTILDVSAAPGGKAIYAALSTNNTGWILANDISYKRAKVLSENVERMGIENCFVSSNTIDELQTSFQAYFDKVILDAPCSGSGMFRKSNEMREDWEYEKVCRLQSLQKELILKSYRLVKQGGYLLYSTCSFSPEENEQVVQYLLDNTHASLSPIPNSPLLQRGLNMPETVRLYPHTFPGEGQFIAWIQSHDEYPSYHKRQKINASTISLEPFWQFVQRYLNRSFDPKRLYINNNHLHYLPVDYPQLPKLALLRSGLHLGQFIKGRFEPSHALALASTIEDWKQVYLVSLDSKEVQAFLKGESFAISQPLEGYVLVCCESVPLGYAKITQGILKNHYPKGLRHK